MKNGKIIKFVKNEYADRRQLAEKRAEENYDKALENDEFSAVAKELAALNFDLAVKKAKGGDCATEQTMLNGLLKKRARILKSIKMSDNDFLSKHICPICNDTGIVNGHFCKCFVKRYYEVLRNYLDIDDIIDFKFSDADFNTVKNAKQREYLKKLYAIQEKYAEKYPHVKLKNALIMGGTGVGKSYLVSAVANRLAERGYNVIMISAARLNKLMLSYHTAPVSDRSLFLDDLTTCDFLIIDDLGSEQKIRNVTDEYLLNILDERESRGKPVYITTNLSEIELKEQYNERLFSRMANKKTTFVREIIGVDLRLN